MSNHHLLYHVILTPKYRRPLLADPGVDDAVRGHIIRMCDKYECTIHALATQPDHVHLMIEIPTKYSISKVVGEAKRVSSWRVRQQYPALKAIRAFWGKKFYVRTVGGDSRVVTKYVQDQVRRIAA
jgi:putative transposase